MSSINKKSHWYAFGFFALTFILGLLSAASNSQMKWNKKNWGPLVPHKTFPKDCGFCHVPKRWDVLRDDFTYDHKRETGYDLEGSHAKAHCLRCHNDRGPINAYVSRGCAGCHSDPHNSQMGQDCTRCHNQYTWQPQGVMSEHAKTRFPLTGMHAAIQCIQCHSRAEVQDFHGAPTDCLACHQTDFQQAPNHTGMNFSHNCKNCHNTSGWSGVRFNHNSLGSSPNCYACHQSDYQSAPNHIAQNYSQSCANCHNTSAWSGAQIDHSAFGATTDCYACHQTDYSQGQNHVALNFPHMCGQCHNTTTWSGTNLNHNFPITGNHNVSCTTCHDASSTVLFNCLGCHTLSETNNDHQGEPGYQYNSPACYNCHPNGN